MSTTKHANDRHGHVAGDSVLREVGECISRNLRGADTAGRYGGDEFCVLLPRATPTQAHEVLERVRAAVSALRFAEAEHLQVSLSIGIAGYSQALADTTAWLNAADAALYQANTRGVIALCWPIRRRRRRLSPSQGDSGRDCPCRRTDLDPGRRAAGRYC